MPSPSLATLQVDGDVHIGPGAEMAGESLQTLAEAMPVVYDVQGEAQPLFRTFQIGVDAGRLPSGVGEDGAAWNAVERILACHERHDRGLDALTQADDG